MNNTPQERNVEDANLILTVLKVRNGSAGEQYTALMNFDAATLAEDTTGGSIHDGLSAEKGTSDTTSLFMGLSMFRGNAMRELEDKLDETGLSNELTRYQRIISELGFELVWQREFKRSDKWGQDDVAQHKYVYTHKQHGFLLHFDTFNSAEELCVNGSHLNYQVIPNGDSARGWNSSGGKQFFDKAAREAYHKAQMAYWDNESKGDRPIEPPSFWEGHHDARQGLRGIVKGLLDNTAPIQMWHELPMPYGVFISYQDHNELDELFGERSNYTAKSALINKLNAERYAETPEWFKKQFNFAIGE